MLIRRVRRVIGVRARAVHESLQPASYLILAAHQRERPGARLLDRRELFDIDKGAISRQVHHLIELGLVDRAPDPEDGRATLLRSPTRARAG